ncbi:MAG TPA: dehydrogenase [Flavisolibacter sp.]|jgi:D-glycero-alpha-D-manno-heptose-7-phosphate kinase|nr:dehydrogenase [Flavisolibacter sp.]
MIYRSKAPLRIGLAGGGTDVSPYCDWYGGAIVNATISLFAHASIELLAEPKIILEAHDRNESAIFNLQEELPIDGQLDLLKGVCNCIQKDFQHFTTGFRLSTFVDAPAGSGLGTSSTLVVAILGAFAEMLQLPLGDYDIAHYAYQIERDYLQWIGGRQDQYAATFGGVNFMEFYKDNKVIVNPLRLRNDCVLELENNLLLYYTATSRRSERIIREQAANVLQQQREPVEAMHQLKRQAQMMKEALLKGQLAQLGEILDYGFCQKRKMATGISNNLIEEIYDAAKRAGATGGKISGAGGGGFMLFYCPGATKYAVMESLRKFGGYYRPYTFVEHGLTTWRI